VLVLGQVRFSPVREIGTSKFLPPIQEAFRQSGFPIERSGKVRQLRVSPTGVEVLEADRWEYRSKDEKWSITLLQDSVALQTTAYSRFEEFAERLATAVGTVLSKTGQDELGIVERVGLRYVDLVQPGAGESYRDYLKPGLHGVSDDVFSADSHRLHLESVGRTRVGDGDGTMIVRITQNDAGFDLPPDLVDGAPQHISRAKETELATLIDLDHFVEGNLPSRPEWVVSTAYLLHDHLIETFHKHVVTPHAIEVWQ